MEFCYLLLAIAVIKRKKKCDFHFLHTISVIQHFPRPPISHIDVSFFRLHSAFRLVARRKKGKKNLHVSWIAAYFEMQKKFKKNSQTIEIALNIFSSFDFYMLPRLPCHQDDMEWYLARNERRMRKIIRKESFLMSSSSLIIIISCLQPPFIFFFKKCHHYKYKVYYSDRRKSYSIQWKILSHIYSYFKLKITSRGAKTKESFLILTSCKRDSQVDGMG